MCSANDQPGNRETSGRVLRKLWWPSVALCLLLFACCVRAQDAAQDDSSWDPFKKLKEKGIAPFFTYYGEEFGNVTGGVGRGAEYEGLLKFGLDLNLEQLVQLNGWKWTGGRLYFAVLYPHGLGITNRYVHDYNVLSNIDAYDSWRLFEAWFEQSFADHRYLFRIGQLTTDANFFVSDSAGPFINSIFGVVGTADHNIIAPIYPVASPGIMVRAGRATDPWYFQAMMVDDNPGAQDGNDKHGLRYDFHHTGALVFYEAGYQHLGTKDHATLEAKYKLGGYYDTGAFPDNAHDFSHHGNYAAYGVIDQQLYRVDGDPKADFRGLAAFVRASFAPRDRNPVTAYFDTGLSYTGLFRGLDKDVLGVAFSFEQLSNELRDDDGNLVPSHHEHVLEATYVWNAKDHLQVQPDLQYIINPSGVGRIPNALALGVSFTLSF